MSPADNRNGAVTGRIVLISFSVMALLLFLSLISHHPTDADYLAGGIEHYVIRNWIGYFGAFVSWRLLLLLGFAAYPTVVLLIVSLGRRLLWRSGLRPAHWDYGVAFVLVSLGLAMLFGIWPELWLERAEGLNIAQIPGGIIGQLLCAPRNGWMRVILNPTGSAIVAGTLTLVGLAVLWSYDWHALFLAAKAAGQNGSNAAAAETPGIAANIKQRVAERRARRQQEKEDKEREAARRLRIQRTRQAAEKPAAPAARTTAERTTPGNGSSGAKQATARKSASPRPGKAYKLPGLELLNKGEDSGAVADPEEIEHKKEILQSTLDSFGIEAAVGTATSGPRVTLFEVEPAPGVKVERISRISNNIAMELQAVSLRILTPIPGRKSVGIEVPNRQALTVSIRSLMESRAWKSSKADIPLVLGRNISGKCVILDLTKAPHLLIAGATGSGKSVCINALITSLLYRFSPEDLRLILVDPKVVEFSCYTRLPHLVVPVITEPKKVPLALRWVINEMKQRYDLFAKVGARNITAFNARPGSTEADVDDSGEPIPGKVPYIVLVIDELADIMMTAKAEVEESLARIAQLSRATGIHTIIATQRPSVNVITGIIKANYPTRIAFQVTSQVDSRTILDGKGAESLLGQGDMLFRPPGASKLERNQSALVQDDEIEKVVQFVADQATPDFIEDVFKVGGSESGDVAGAGEEISEQDEESIQRAIEVIKRDRRATTSYVQRSLRIGYNRSAMIMEILEQRGIVGPQVGSAPREILIDADTEDDVEEQGDAEVDPDLDGMDDEDAVQRGTA